MIAATLYSAAQTIELVRGSISDMKVLKTAFLSLIALGTLAGGLSAQTTVDDPAGFRVQVPAGYQVQQDASGTVCSDGNTIVVVKSHAYGNFESFAQNANLQQDGFTLVGEVQSLNGTDRHFRASKPNPQGGYLIADTFVRFSPHGGGCMIVALSSSEQAERGFYAAQEVSKGVVFSQAAGAGNVWETALAGKHLLYLYTGNGYSERFDLYLFANRTFSTRSDTSSVSMNGSGATAGGGEGSWRISPAGQLVLSYHNGSQQVYQLAPRQASNEVSLNGKRFFVTTQ